MEYLDEKWIRFLYNGAKYELSRNLHLTQQMKTKKLC